MTILRNIIADEIKEKEKIPFKRFMEMALYYPELGYYTSKKPKIGTEGDFYTSSDVTSLFGEMLGEQVVEMWFKLEQPDDFYVVEYGAGKGFLARDLLKRLQQKDAKVRESLTYVIIEISPTLRELQRETIEKLGLPQSKIKWVNNLEEVNDGKQFTGCILSNELLDAFPVHVVKQEDALRETYVKLKAEGEFDEMLGAPSTEKIAEFLSKSGVELTPGQKIEVNLNALEWLEQAAIKLSRGYIVTIDYGYLAKELAAPHRFDGTLVCYEKHQMKTNPYQNIGGRDITAHVNFSSLITYGEDFGLTNLGFTNQGRFLLALGILDWLKEQKIGQLSSEQLSKVQSVKNLILPGGMGEVFKVLIQGKGLTDDESELQGLKSPY